MDKEQLWDGFRPLTSAANPLYQALKKQTHQRKIRSREGVIILEGVHLLGACLDAGWQPDLLVVSDSGRQSAEIAALVRQLVGVPGILLPDGLFNSLSSLETPAGILARVALPAGGVPEWHDACVLIEDVQDPGNLGTLLRTAAAAGIRLALLSQACADAWSPKTLRAGMGAHFQLQICENVDLESFARNHAGPVIATTLDSDQSLYQTNLTGCCAFIFGNEGAGVSTALQALATVRIKIPMPGAVESLNVAAAAAICLFERVRQHAAAAMDLPEI